MTRVEVKPAEIERVVGIVNAWSPRAHAAAGTQPEVTDGLGRGGDGHPPVAGSVAGLGRVANRLHEVFVGDADHRLSVLNELIQRVRPVPVVTPDGPAWLVRAEDAGMAELVLALWAHAASDSSFERLGICNGGHCVDAFVDRTRAGSRRYCSLTCQNRSKVAAYRSRHRPSTR
jgi:predicted RNA-binding Zn ribbon-like protein